MFIACEKQRKELSKLGRQKERERRMRKVIVKSEKRNKIANVLDPDFSNFNCVVQQLLRLRNVLRYSRGTLFLRRRSTSFIFNHPCSKTKLKLINVQVNLYDPHFPHLKL